MSGLYSAAQVREFDRRAIQDHGIPGVQLMTRAGTAAWRVLQARYPRARRIVLLCGSGNNGGDGYVLARLAKQAGFEPMVFALGDSARSGADAAAVRAQAETVGVAVHTYSGQSLPQCDVIVDALLGTGLERMVEGEWRRAIEAMNAGGQPILSIDIPSGLNADTGTVMGAAVKANITVSFIGLKTGLFTGAGREHAGEILFDDLDVPADIYNGVAPFARRMTERDMRGLVRRRARDAHKGAYGHVLVVGGGIGMPGAVRLCGEAALRAGSGLVTLATHPNHAAAVNSTRPELLAYPVRTLKDLTPLAARADVVALGPGLSQDKWARGVFRAALGLKLPMVIDADALNLLSAKPVRRNDWVLTPHPGEAARLLKTTTAKVEENRFDALRRLVKRFGGVCVLKGSGTLIASADDDTIWLCDRGNPGMASGGTGDVLTGAIAALYAQGLSALGAAQLGVWLHASAGDRMAEREGEVGLLAGDLVDAMRAELNRLTT